MPPAIQCLDSSRYFPKVKANDHINLTIEPHQIFGLLGPNGCGKTTLLHQLQGLDAPTSGTVKVLGLDPRRDRQELMARIGTQLQEARVIPRLKVIEVLTTFGSFYPQSQDPMMVLESVGLAAKAGAFVDKLSGGQRQRVFIALALIHNPELLFFDELTSALDPQSRLKIWDILRDLKAAGRTVILTTHSMEEAQTLCDRIAIMDAGHIIAEGTPDELIDEFAQGSTLKFSVSGTVQPAPLEKIPGVTSVDIQGQDITVIGKGDFTPHVMQVLTDQHVSPAHMSLNPATLEDVFLHLTGRSLQA